MKTGDGLSMNLPRIVLVISLLVTSESSGQDMVKIERYGDNSHVYSIHWMERGCRTQQECPNWMYCNTQDNICEPCTVCSRAEHQRQNMCKLPPTYCDGSRKGSQIRCPLLEVEECRSLTCLPRGAPSGSPLGTKCSCRDANSTLNNRSIASCQWESQTSRARWRAEVDGLHIRDVAVPASRSSTVVLTRTSLTIVTNVTLVVTTAPTESTDILNLDSRIRNNVGLQSTVVVMVFVIVVTLIVIAVVLVKKHIGYKGVCAGKVSKQSTSVDLENPRRPQEHDESPATPSSEQSDSHLLHECQRAGEPTQSSIDSGTASFAPMQCSRGRGPCESDENSGISSVSLVETSSEQI